jgi:hypothetical protein
MSTKSPLTPCPGVTTALNNPEPPGSQAQVSGLIPKVLVWEPVYKYWLMLDLAFSPRKPQVCNLNGASKALFFGKNNQLTLFFDKKL